jgi:hypothetical protein
MTTDPHIFLRRLNLPRTPPPHDSLASDGSRIGHMQVEEALKLRLTFPRGQRTRIFRSTAV